MLKRFHTAEQGNVAIVFARVANPWRTSSTHMVVPEQQQLGRYCPADQGAAERPHQTRKNPARTWSDRTGFLRANVMQQPRS